MACAWWRPRGSNRLPFEEGEDHDDEKHHESEEDAEQGDHEDHEGEEEHEDHDHHHGAFDPHAWQSLSNAVAYVDNITAALAQANPVNATGFYQNRAIYVAEIEALDAESTRSWQTYRPSAAPSSPRTTPSNILARDYGLTFLAPQGLSTESEASAQDVARLIEQMRAEGISAVFVENITDSRLLEQIANETGASVGGTLYPGALSGSDGPAPTYLDMMRHNATTLAQALE